MGSPSLYGDRTTVLSVYAYDAEEHADSVIFHFLRRRDPMDEREGLRRERRTRL